jgi:hypothetical protein
MGLDTVEESVLVPTAYCQHFTRPKIANYWSKKDKPVRSEDINVVVSVTQRKEPPLINDLLTLVLTGQLSKDSSLRRASFTAQVRN